MHINILYYIHLHILEDSRKSRSNRAGVQEASTGTYPVDVCDFNRLLLKDLTLISRVLFCNFISHVNLSQRAAVAKTFNSQLEEKKASEFVFLFMECRMGFHVNEICFLVHDL